MGRLRVRDLFSVVALLLVAVLCAALAVPYFVDWDARRADVETALGRAFGVGVRTEGAITVRLLPTPRLALERVAVGGDAPFLTAEGLDVALEAAPLISGRIEVTSARLVRPELRLLLDGDGTPRLPPAGDGAPLVGLDSAGVARLEIEQGAIRVTGIADGAPVEHVVGPVDASASAPTLAGPWRIEGRYGHHTVHLATGTPGEDGRVRLKLRATDTRIGANADLDGHVQYGDRPGFAGRFGLSLPLPRDASGAAQDASGETQDTSGKAQDASGKAEDARLTATADIAGEGWRFAASNLDIRAGEGAGAVTLTGEGALDAGALRTGGRPRVTLDLDARRLDARPLAAAWARGDATVAEGATRLLGGLPIDLSLDVASLAYAGEEFGPASLALRTDPAGEGVNVSLPRLDLALPGGGRFTVEGGAFDAVAGFSGRVGLTVGEAGRLANAVRDAAMNAATVDELGLMLRLSQTLRDWPGLGLTGHVEVSPAGVAVQGLDASAGESALSGDIVFTHQLGGQRAHASARLAVQGVDLAALPRFDPMIVSDSGIDLDVELEARRLRFGAAPASEGRHLAARFSTAEDGVTIERFDLVDPDGARLAASGHLGDDGGRVAATVEAEDPAALLALGRPFLPAVVGDAFARAAPALGPLALEATVARPGAGSPLVAVVKGSAAATAIEGRIVSDPRGEAGDRALIDLRLASPDAGELLRQLGLAGQEGAAAAAVPGELVLNARGNAFAALDGRASLSAGDSRVTLDGRWRADKDGPALSGPVQIETPDAGALAALLRRPLPAFAEPVAASLAGALEWRPDDLAIRDLKGAVAGVPVTGALSMAGEGLRGELGLERLDAGDLLSVLLGPGARPRAGQVWSSQRLGGAGPAVAGTLALKVRELAVTPALTLADAALTLDAAPETLTLALADTAVAGGGQASGEIALRRLGAQVNLRGRLDVRKVGLAALAQREIAGEATGALEFGASAESVAGIIANLAGGGELRIAGAAIPGLDPGALERTVAALVARETVEVDTGRVATLLAAELDAGAWPVPELAAPLTLASGTLRFGPLTLEAGPARAGVSGSLDLAGLTLDARAHLSGLTVPEGWSGAPPQAIVVWQGPTGQPERRVDAGSIANGLAAIGLTRELDRIERLEAEARERIEKARRDREERARLAEERRIREQQEEEQRQAEQRLEEQRLEEQRQQEERARAEAERQRIRLEELAREAARNPPRSGTTPETSPETVPPAEPGPAAPPDAAPLDIRPPAQDPS